MVRAASPTRGGHGQTCRALGRCLDSEILLSQAKEAATAKPAFEAAAAIASETTRIEEEFSQMDL